MTAGNDSTATAQAEPYRHMLALQFTLLNVVAAGLLAIAWSQGLIGRALAADSTHFVVVIAAHVFFVEHTMRRGHSSTHLPHGGFLCLLRHRIRGIQLSIRCILGKLVFGLQTPSHVFWKLRGWSEVRNATALPVV